MPYLIAQGKQPHHRWRRLLPEGIVVTLGRTTPRWNVPWDPQISRMHAHLQLEGESLLVECHETASNAVYYQGQKIQQFKLQLNQHFVIGETSFSLVPSELAASLIPDSPAAEQTFMLTDLHKIPFEETSHRIELLSKLPTITASAADEQELLSKIIDWLFLGITRASGIALVRQLLPEDGEVEVMHWDYRGRKDTYFSPSQALINQAIKSQMSIIHFWNQDTESEYTELQEIDWGFCIPMQGEACQNWGLYIAGKTDTTSRVGSDSLTQFQVKQDMKYAELASSTLSHLRSLKNMERLQAHFQQFFPDVVVDALLSGSSEELLTPRETDLSIMFCDLSGFSNASEDSAADLMNLLQSTSDSLSLITQQILAQDGVIGDFHGDEAMGFWGWPVAETPEIHARKACAAALEILTSFLSKSAFGATIGIASGVSVAGEIGSNHQVKVSVLGPVVNLASRLESMNRYFGTSILIDERTSALIGEALQEAVLIRLGRVRPYGMERAVQVSTLLGREDAAQLHHHLENYAKALAALEENNLQQAHKLLLEITATEQPQLKFANVLLGHVELHLTLANKKHVGLQKSEPHVIHLAMK